MRRVLLLIALLGGLACRGPEAGSPPPARLTVHFLDRDAVCGLPRPMPGAWAFMDAGLWRDLDTVWTDLQGRGAVDRTAPQRVLLRDPEGAIHRIALSDAPDALQGARLSDREDMEDQAEGLLVVWLWFSQALGGR